MRLQGCRGQEGRGDAWGEGGVEERWRERESKSEREREREREGEGAQWPVVSVGLYGPVDVAARAVAGVCSTHLLKPRQKRWYRRRHMGYTCTQSAQTQAHVHEAQTHAGAALQW